MCLSFITAANRCSSYCGRCSHFPEVETGAQRGQETIQSSTASRGGAEIQIQALTSYVVTLKSFRAIQDLKKNLSLHEKNHFFPGARSASQPIMGADSTGVPWAGRALRFGARTV